METQYFDFKNNYQDDILNTLGNQLKHGAVGIFPTDTVYGIGCNALDEMSIHKLFAFKKRNYSKPINVLISDCNMLQYLVDNVSHVEKKLIEAFWPGALTIIFNKKRGVSNLLTANLNTIGVRMPANDIALQLIANSGIPLATTSANISGASPGIHLSDFYSDFKDKIDFIIDSGDSELKLPSTIIKIVNNDLLILREGSISKKDIKKVLGGTINVK